MYIFRNSVSIFHGSPLLTGNSNCLLQPKSLYNLFQNIVPMSSMVDLSIADFLGFKYNCSLMEICDFQECIELDTISTTQIDASVFICSMSSFIKIRASVNFHSLKHYLYALLILEQTVKQIGSSSLTFVLCPTYEYKVNESLKSIFSKLRQVDIEQMKTEASKYLDYKHDLNIEN